VSLTEQCAKLQQVFEVLSFSLVIQACNRFATSLLSCRRHTVQSQPRNLLFRCVIHLRFWHP